MELVVLNLWANPGSFGTDNRSFAGSSGTSRMQTDLIPFDSSSIGSPWLNKVALGHQSITTHAGLSHRALGFWKGNTWAIVSVASPVAAIVTERHFQVTHNKCNKTRIVFSYQSSYPYLAVGPNIWYHADITLTRQSNGSVVADYQLGFSGFPAFEFMINDRVIDSYIPTWGGPGLFSIGLDAQVAFGRQVKIT